MAPNVHHRTPARDSSRAERLALRYRIARADARDARASGEDDAHALARDARRYAVALSHGPVR